MATIECCDHGRPLVASEWWRAVPCEDCDQDEWRRTRKDTLIGLAAMLVIIYVPLFLLLMGVFW